MSPFAVLLVEASKLLSDKNSADLIRVFFLQRSLLKIISRNASQAEALREIIPEAIRFFFRGKLIRTPFDPTV